MNIGTQNKISWKVFFVAAGFCGLIAGCSSKPSEGDGSRAIQNQIAQDSQGRIKLVEFHKTNGQMAEINAVKVYTLEFNVKIEFYENCKWITGNFGQELGFRTGKLVAAPNSGFSWGKFMDDSQNPGPPMQKGQRVQIFGEIVFEKKENGWSVDRVKLTRYVIEKSQQAIDAEKKIAALRELASKGDAKAQYELGNKLLDDADGSSDEKVEAVKWFRSSTEQGYALGQNALGWMYEKGIVLSKDCVEAARLYRMAADQGEPKGMFNLAQLLQNGEGVSQDVLDAVRLYRLAADQGFSPAMLKLGELYHIGAYNTNFSKKIFEVDKKEAVNWYKKAADLGELDAQIELANMYENGDGVVKSDTLALEYYRKMLEPTRKLAEMGDSIAQIQLAHIYEYGKGVPTNKAIALDWYRKVVAADPKSPFASRANNKILELSTDPADVARRESIDCVNNLKMIGLSFRIWMGNHNDTFPFNLSSSAGGVAELCSRGDDGFDMNSSLIFQVMSNELAKTQILVCPSDSNKKPALDFQHLLSSNVSYKVHSGSNVNESNPREVLVRCPIHGHVLLCNGGVQAGNLQSASTAK